MFWNMKICWCKDVYLKMILNFREHFCDSIYIQIFVINNKHIRLDDIHHKNFMSISSILSKYSESSKKTWCTPRSWLNKGLVWINTTFWTATWTTAIIAAWIWIGLGLGRVISLISLFSFFLFYHFTWFICTIVCWLLSDD